VSPSNQAPLSGREAAVAWARTFPKITHLTIDVQEVNGEGAVAYVRGTYAFSVILPDGSPATEWGALLQVHRREADGGWPYTHVMWHSTEPATAFATSGQ
jgi:ketosteroid isomerase-like protein